MKYKYKYKIGRREGYSDEETSIKLLPRWFQPDLFLHLHLDIDIRELVGEGDDDKVFARWELLRLQEVILAKGGMVHLDDEDVDGADDEVVRAHLVRIEGKPCGLNHLVGGHLGKYN